MQDNPQNVHQEDPYVKSDLRTLGITVLIIAIIFSATAFANVKTSVIQKISEKLHLATLNNN